MAAEIVLETKDAFKSFEGFVAIRDVSIDLKEGEKHAIIGPNGAGRRRFSTSSPAI